MSYLRERVAYLKGLAEGMKVSEATNEGKLMKAIIDVLDDFALAVEDIEELHDQLSEQVDSMDEDLTEMERVIFDELDEEEDDEDNFIEIECPHCNEKIEVSADMIDEDNNTIECPSCHEDIEFRWECGCEDHEHDH